MMTDRNSRCAVCGRHFNSQSRPQWMFRMDGTSMGLGHVSCAQKVLNGGVGQTGPGSYTEDQARFHFWCWYVREHQRARGAFGNWRAEDQAALLASSPDEAEDQRTQELLDWWHVGPLQYSEAKIAAIRLARLELVRRYREWVQTIPVAETEAVKR